MATETLTTTTAAVARAGDRVAFPYPNGYPAGDYDSAGAVLKVGGVTLPIGFGVSFNQTEAVVTPAAGGEIPAGVLVLAVNYASSPAADAISHGDSTAWRSGVIPKLHLPKFAVASPAVVVIVGDSTSTELATGTGPSESLWHHIRRRMREDNPGKSITFHNRAIGGTAWATLASASTTDPGASKTWTWAAGQTWLAQLQSLAPDVLIFNFGINDSYGLLPSQIVTVMTAVNAWTKVPDIIFCTNAAPSFSSPSGRGVTRFVDGCMQAASMQRNIALSGAYGLGVTIPPVGLIDVNRRFHLVRDGVDVASQSMVKSISTPITGITTFPRTLDKCQGDFDLTFTFDTGAPITNAFKVDLNNEIGTIFQIDNGNGGNVRARFLIATGGTFVSSPNGSTTLPVPAGATTINLIAKGAWLYCTVNGTIVFDSLVARPASPFSPVIRLIGANSPTMTLTQYAIAAPYEYDGRVSDARLFGTPNGPEGGNGDNHMSSSGIATVVQPVVDATRFSASEA